MEKELKINGFENMPELLKERYYVYHNNDFMLKTIDSELESIDPYNLPEENRIELIARINEECEKNPWYFFRKMLRQVTGEPFTVNVATLTLLRLMLNGANVIYKTPRQTWATTTVAGMMIWEAIYRPENKSNLIRIFGDDAADMDAIMMRVHRMLDRLPAYIIDKSMLTISEDRTEFQLSGSSILKQYICLNGRLDSDYPGSWFVDDAEYSSIDPRSVRSRDGRDTTWRVFRIHGISDSSSHDSEQWRQMIKEAFPWNNALHALPDIAIKEIAHKNVIYVKCAADEILSDEQIATMKSVLDSVDDDDAVFRREVLLEDDYSIDPVFTSSKF